jgi:glycosyltransferase involved in cell wall biosynthesis
VSPKQEIYSPGKLSYEWWNTYLKVFERLIVVGRSYGGNEINYAKMSISSGENVSFKFVPNIATTIGILRNWKKVKKALNRTIASVDAVVARTSLLGYLAAVEAQKLKKPWAAEVVACSWDAVWNYGNMKGRVTAPLYYLWQRQMVKEAPFALYVTQEFLQKRYPCKGSSKGVSDVNIPPIDDECRKLRKQKALSLNTPIVFGLIGSLNSKWKGIQTAFAALKDVIRELPKFTFRILGDGDQSYWKHLAISNGLESVVQFDGTLPSGDAVFRWLDELDVYIQPSFQEGLPRSLVEAMSRGCPALGSTAGGIPELLDSSVLHRPGDSKQLGKLLLYSLNTDWRVQQSADNFSKAKFYERDLLDKRRSAFWCEFGKYVKQHLNNN